MAENECVRLLFTRSCFVFFPGGNLAPVLSGIEPSAQPQCLKMDVYEYKKTTDFTTLLLDI